MSQELEWWDESGLLFVMDLEVGMAHFLAAYYFPRNYEEKHKTLRRARTFKI
jgi:hypothetical protein